MSCARVLLSVAPLPVTFWGVLAGTLVVAVLLTLLMVRHAGSARADRVRERVRGQLGPVFARFLETDDPVHLAEELRPAFIRLNAAERPVAAVFITEVMREATPSQTEKLRSALERAGIVALGERGTRRRSPWRRALACELLGKIGVGSSVPALLERLGDRRPEVRMAAVRALGDIESAEAVPALEEQFLGRRCAPTAVVNYALRKIGGEAATVFERGMSSPDPIVRISSCFGLAAIAPEAGDAAPQLAELLASDADAQVRSAAAGALGIVGGEHAPGALLDASSDPDDRVRRAAMKALGSFDDPTSGETLAEHVEDQDRETAIRAAEALFALTRRPRAAPEARARIESSSAWAVEYARRVAEVSTGAEVSA